MDDLAISKSVYLGNFEKKRWSSSKLEVVSKNSPQRKNRVTVSPKKTKRKHIDFQGQSSDNKDSRIYSNGSRYHRYLAISSRYTEEIREERQEDLEEVPPFYSRAKLPEVSQFDAVRGDYTGKIRKQVYFYNKKRSPPLEIVDPFFRQKSREIASRISELKIIEYEGQYAIDI